MPSTLEIVIKGRDDGASGVFDKVGGSLNKLAGIAAGVAVAGLAAVGAGIASSIGAAMEAQDELAELEAVIASTGGAAGVTADFAQELATNLQNVTRFSDDAILAGESMLLTFTNIGQDVFPAATETMLNLAQKMGTDPVNAAMQLGKALNDPIDGVAALRRVGVQLTEQQEEQIAGFMAVNDVASAQRVILGELDTEFGGLAVAAGATAAGGIDIFWNKLGDVQERIGGAFLPLVDQLVDKFSAGLDSAAFQSALTTTTAVIGDLVNVIIPLTEGDTLAALHNFQVALAGIGIDPQQIAGITELLTGDIFGSMMETPAGMVQTGGLLRRMGMSDEDVASAQDSIDTIVRESERIGEAFSKIFAAGTGDAAEGASKTVQFLQDVAWAMEKIAAAGDVAAQIRAIVDAVGAGGAANAIIKEGTGFDIAGTDQFLKSDQMSRQGLMSSAFITPQANPLKPELGIPLVNIDMNALAAAITGAIQSAPPATVTMPPITLDGRAISETVSGQIGRQAAGMRRGGGFPGI